MNGDQAKRIEMVMGFGLLVGKNELIISSDDH